MNNMKKEILQVDMDGVICCFETGVKAIEPDMPWDRENVDRVCEANPRVFLTLPEIEGAKEALDELNELYDVYFASTPMWNVPESYMDKRIYIESKFPWAEKKLILTHNKGLLRGKFIIDDRTVNGVDQFEGEHIHFGTEKFPDWKTILEYLKSKV
jgi:5'(3')-deoxyribonucleotidase